jgi:tetratricopeptide (TPR) repeat protein
MIRAILRGTLLSCLGTLPLLAQSISTTLLVREKAGFLGMGGPRHVIVAFATQNGDTVLTSESANAGPHYFFRVQPMTDWKIEEDFVKEYLSTLVVYQNGEKHAIVWKGTLMGGPPTWLVLGFPKTFKLHQSFLFQVTSDGKTYQAEMSIPTSLWPGFTMLVQKYGEATSAMARGDHRGAITASEQIISNSALNIFAQYEEARSLRTQAFNAYLASVSQQFQQTLADTGGLKGKIARVESFRPYLQFVVDSLPRASLNIGSLDPTVYPIIERARNAMTALQTSRDSLQRELDDRNTRWIVEGSAIGKNGFLYQYMIETLAYAFSSANFRDTTSTGLRLTLSDELQQRLERHQLVESYETFLRLTVERMQTNLPMFPVEFLPNLRKDTASFPQPYYSILKAVNDYYYGNLKGTLEEVSRVFLTCTDPELNARTDRMRVMIGIRRGEAPAEVVRLLEEAERLEAANDSQSALERYRQATLLAPNFAYAFFAFGSFYDRTGDPIRAINFFQTAYQVDSVYLSAYREASNMYLRQGNFKPMIDVLLYALQHGNDNWEINYNLGTAFLGDNDPARAIMHFERALALNAKSYRTNIQLGLAHQAVKDFQKAREYFNAAIGLDPTRQEAVDYLTRLNEMQRNQ